VVKHRVRVIFHIFSSCSFKWYPTVLTYLTFLFSCVLVDSPLDEEQCLWSHPFDLHYTTRGISGWPRMHFQVYAYDDGGRYDLAGYGFCHLPSAPGTHTIECNTWRPSGSWKEQLQNFFLGSAPELKNERLVWSGDDRYRLKTVTTGTVTVQVHVILRGFSDAGVLFA